MTRRLLGVFIAVLTLLSQQAAHAEAKNIESQKIKAVATVGMVADVVKAVGGDRVIVDQLMGSGIDPHSYRQTRSDVARLAGADIIFANGLHLEAQLTPLLHKLSKRKPVVAVAEGLGEGALIEAGGFAGRYDPHVWMDPSLWAKTADVVSEALTTYDPKSADFYKNNAKTYQKTVEKLALRVGDLVATVKPERRALITAHDAFNYFGRAYDVDVIGIQGLSTESEAGLNRIEALVDLLVKRKITAVFVESSVSDHNIKALLEGAQARNHRVTIGGTLYSDAMGPAGTFEGTYLGMIDHNATTITRALGGDAPERGILGKLDLQS